MGHAGELFCVSFAGDRIVSSSIPLAGRAEEEPTRYVGYILVQDCASRSQLHYILIQILIGADGVTEEKREKVRAYARWLVHDQHPHLLWKGLEDIPVIFLDEW